jgi:hypothetical protein
MARHARPPGTAAVAPASTGSRLRIPTPSSLIFIRTSVRVGLRYSIVRTFSFVSAELPLTTKLSYQLRDQKLDKLEKLETQLIVSANVGCIAHLQSGTSTPVTHWIQLLEHLLYG